MNIVLGLDVGGANTKASIVRFETWQDFAVLLARSWYFPFWIKKDKFEVFLKDIRLQLLSETTWEKVGVTMTAELADCFRTKKEGVSWIAQKVCNVFDDQRVFFLTINGEMVHRDFILKNPILGSATNWVATAKMVGKFFPNCILIDVGSTTTDIIPIKNGESITKGRTDPERLVSGELVYTGALRTNIATMVQSVPTIWGESRVSSELFAVTGDVHLVLGNIMVEEYTTDTPDGVDPSLNSSLTRLARLVCADAEMLSKDQILDMARFIYGKQLNQIEEALMHVIKRNEEKLGNTPKLVVTGIGSDFLAHKTAKLLGLNDIINLSDFVGKKANKVSASFAVACLTMETSLSSIWTGGG